MPSKAWKDLERRVVRALGAERRGTYTPGGRYQAGSDDDGSAAFSIEVKRTARLQLRQRWIEQAQQNAKQTRRPWLLVIGTHHSRHPVAVLDFASFVEVCYQAGLIDDRRFRLERAVGTGHADGFDADAHVDGVVEMLEERRL